MSFKRGQVDSIYLDFKHWLYEEVDDNARIHMCENSTLEKDEAKLWVSQKNKNENNKT